MKRKDNEKQIAPVLRKMKLGEHETYPCERKVSVENTRNRIQAQLRHLGYKYTIRTIGNDIIITRIA